MQRKKKGKKLEVKDIVSVDRLPPETDFWIAGKNTLYITNNCSFLNDIVSLMGSTNGFDENSIKKIELIKLTSYTFSLTKWARDVFATKSSDAVYTVHNDGTMREINFSGDQIAENKHLSYYHHSGEQDYRTDDLNAAYYKPSQVVAAGGNVFHCVNAIGIQYTIVGEGGISSVENRKNIGNPDPDSKVGKKSLDKYPNLFEGRDDVVKKRQRNKQLLTQQISENSAIIIVPNACWAHIDLSMAVLPNGVVLLHSFNETLKLLETLKEKRQISDAQYQDSVAVAKQFLEESQPLLDETKRKLEKRDFIVKEVCGILADRVSMQGIYAMGFNGLPFVTYDGHIGYTLPPGPEFFKEYFTQALHNAGVSIVHNIISVDSLELLKREGGFIRCQTNTVPSNIPKNEEALSSESTDNSRRITNK